MLQSLISLTDEEITAVTDAVRQWCSQGKVDIDSSEGRRAITAAIDLIQTNGTRHNLFANLSQRLSPGETLILPEDADLAGRRIMIVEDDFLFASDLRTALSNRGAQVIGPCPSEEDALSKIELGKPAGAVVDIDLGSGACFQLSRILAERDIPFIFVTGYDKNIIPAEFAGVPFHQKPVEPAQIVPTIAAVFANVT